MVFWKAIYRDGSCLMQFNSDGSENRYTAIRRNELSQFLLFHGGEVLLVLHLDEGKKLIYRRRVAVHFKIGPQGKTGEESVYIVGWQENRRGVNVQSLCFVFEDGHIEVLDRFCEGTRWFYAVKFLPEEAV